MLKIILCKGLMKGLPAMGFIAYICNKTMKKINNQPLFRLCPVCQNKITYAYKSDLVKANKKNCFCKKCMINNGKFARGQKTANKDSHYVCWERKYGKEIAQTKLNQEKQLHSKNNRGKGNPMYGKPAPIGSGNGWSGWYKGWYFRSLLELSFMINVIERFNMPWISAENQTYKISYIDINLKQRNYYADFIIDNKYIVECKPKWQLNLKINKLKFNQARSFCSDNKMIYKVMTPKSLSDEELINLYTTKQIKFIKKYDTKFRKKYRSSL